MRILAKFDNINYFYDYLFGGVWLGRCIEGFVRGFCSPAAVSVDSLLLPWCQLPAAWCRRSNINIYLTQDFSSVTYGVG